MATFGNLGGWTAASLLPSLAAGFSPGAAWPLAALGRATASPAPVKPVASVPAVKPPATAKPATDKSSRTPFQTALLKRIMGDDFSKSAISQSGANPAVNALSAPPKLNLAAILGLPQV